MYLIKTPFWLKLIYKKCIWNKNRKEKVLYLTFDDGPHEIATHFALNELKRFNAKATFFCIGKNVALHPTIFEKIVEEGHSVGNHTNNHLNGWKCNNKEYIANMIEAKLKIGSNLFRPPYGRIKHSQINALQTLHADTKIIMWDVLSGDFDINLSKQKCLDNVLKNAQNGSIIVFHDSTKAWERMEFALPRVLEHFSKIGFEFKAL